MVYVGPMPYATLRDMTEKELLTLLASRIRANRKRLGLTIEALAGASGIDAGYLAHVETASKTPSLSVLAKLMNSLDVSPEELLGRTTPKTRDTPDSVVRRLHALIRALKPAQRTDLLAVLGKLRKGDQVRGLRLLLRA